MNFDSDASTISKKLSTVYITVEKECSHLKNRSLISTGHSLSTTSLQHISRVIKYDHKV